MNNAFNMIMRTTALMRPQPFIMRQALRPFSMGMMQTQNESFNMMFEKWNLETFLMFDQQVIEQTLECKKNKATKQAQRKRNKRKTGAQINVRFK